MFFQICQVLFRILLVEDLEVNQHVLEDAGGVTGDVVEDYFIHESKVFKQSSQQENKEEYTDQQYNPHILHVFIIQHLK